MGAEVEGFEGVHCAWWIWVLREDCGRLDNIEIC